MAARLLTFVSLLLPGVRGVQITTTTRQTIHGVGASGAWWVNDLALYPDDVRQNVSDLLLNQTTGLGLTDYRYNLGGGGVGVTTWDRAPETPYVSDGVYNWSADAAGTYYLREAARQGVPVITLFVNSAPITMTSNNQSCGGDLVTERIPAYAQYLTDVISHWKSEGVEITHVSPMNEPDDSFGSCNQEGMQVVPGQRAEVVTTLAASLKAAGLSTLVIADESSDTTNYNNDEPVWLNATVGESLGGNCHHLYNFASAATQQEVFEYGRNLSGGVPTWFSEICCYNAANSNESDDPLATLTYSSQYDPTMLSGLRMAHLVWQSFTYAEDSHWDWWTALSNEIGCTLSSNATCWDNIQSSGWDDGLIYYDPDYNSTENYNIKLTKRYSVLKQFTKGVPVGAVRRAVTPDSDTTDDAWRVLAFDYDSACEQYSTCAQVPYSVVAMNAQWNASSITLTSNGTFALTQPVAMYRTSVTEDYAEAEVPTLSANGSLEIDAPEMSIVTLFF
ncbi:glycoside hydrolase [Rhodofomes roseus]|uniref:Glycoside hydrolase n=1 Tax=Rhodofomes roseus TaxID=34475 RepID=A0ABQ8KWR0_9APHY|nr:glycoside hydrolase [Rhodofomes roseus]KAH9843739.1 glycoside hydrolase [Rhodofomes roseus]